MDREIKALKKKKSELLREIASFHEMGSEEKIKKVKKPIRAGGTGINAER